MLEIVDPGLSSTIQDHGRPGLAHLGIRRAGAADPLALRVANLLVGEAVDAPALEMTLLGATFAVHADCLVGIAGADMGIDIAEDGRSLGPGASYRLRSGTTLRCGGAVDGARTYLALAGRLRAERVLGSASTDLSAGFGGIDGRRLRPGDVLGPERMAEVDRPERRWPPDVPSSGVGRGGAVARAIAVTPGPHADLLGTRVTDVIMATTWRVSPRSDRVGIRLEAADVPLPDERAGDLVSFPMVVGAVQVPPDGRPIVLSVDAPTVGGYPVAGVVIEADLPAVAQLRPGDAVRFEWLDLDAARRRSSDSAAALEDAARRLAFGVSS